MDTKILQNKLIKTRFDLMNDEKNTDIFNKCGKVIILINDKKPYEDELKSVLDKFPEKFI